MQVCQRLVVHVESEFYSVNKSHKLSDSLDNCKKLFLNGRESCLLVAEFLTCICYSKWFSPYSCINIAPTPTSDVSTRRKKCLSCSGNMSMGQADSAIFNAEYALSCTSFHSSLFGNPFFVKSFRGTAMAAWLGRYSL